MLMRLTYGLYFALSSNILGLVVSLVAFSLFMASRVRLSKSIAYSCFVFIGSAVAKLQWIIFKNPGGDTALLSFISATTVLVGALCVIALVAALHILREERPLLALFALTAILAILQFSDIPHSLLNLYAQFYAAACILVPLWTLAFSRETGKKTKQMTVGLFIVVGIFLALIIYIPNVPNTPEWLPVKEVRVIEREYAPEIRYMRELLDEIPNRINTTDSESLRQLIPFDREWTQGPARRTTEPYRFYALRIGAPNGETEVLAQTAERSDLNRLLMEVSRNVQARYTENDVTVERILDIQQRPDYAEMMIYSYRISQSVDNGGFFVVAIFEAPK
jgi:hypothetical protein